AAAARLTLSAAESSAFAVRWPNFKVSSVKTITVPRGAVENGTKPILTASDIARTPGQTTFWAGPYRPFWDNRAAKSGKIHITRGPLAACPARPPPGVEKCRRRATTNQLLGMPAPPPSHSHFVDPSRRW